jgi:tRNA U34 5-carboxymethylaminomethyl modifying GTPase MnmE/TrmE
MQGQPKPPASGRPRVSGFVIPGRPAPQSSAAGKHLWFGPEPESAEPWPAVLDALARFRSLHLERLERIAAAAQGARDDNSPHAAVFDLASRHLDPIRFRVQPSMRDRRSGLPTADGLRVVLMGRTMAGKSTLLEALTDGDGSRIGDGRQRFSRDVHERPVGSAFGLEGVVLVDTPGVGAKDGEEDYELAFSQVPTADLVVWVAANDSTQEETAAALRALAVLGKPVIVTLNCRVDLDHPAKILDFLEDPEFGFGESEGHLRVIERHLAAFGVSRVGAVLTHAEAAHRAKRDAAASRALLARSRVHDLVEALREEKDRLGDQRRLLRTIDATRSLAHDDLIVVLSQQQALSVLIDRETSITDDLDKRLGRVLAKGQEDAQQAVIEVIDRRSRWHLSLDVEDDVERSWAREMELLSEELMEALQESGNQLASEVESTFERVQSEWEAIPVPESALDDIPGFGSAHANRWLKVGAGAIVGLALLFGGLPLIAAAPLGAVASVLLVPLKKQIDVWFHGREEVVRRRRASVASKMVPILDGIRAEACGQVDQMVTSQRDAIDAWMDARRRAIQSQRGVSALWAEEVAQGWTDMGDLDLETARAVLRLSGRGRLAGGVVAATRRPGVATVIQLSEEKFSEGALCPAVGLAEVVVPTPIGSGGDSHRVALHALLGLTTSPLSVGGMSRRVDVTVHHHVPEGVRNRWSELVTAASGHPTTIASGDPGREGTE